MTLIENSPFRSDDPLQQLLDRYLLSGDEEAMEEVVARTRGRLLAVARRIGKPQDAEDAVQTAYFSLIRKRGKRLEAPVLPWLLTAVVRIAYRQKAVNQRQHQIARRLSRPTRTPSPLPEIANAEEAERMRKEITRLPSKYRDPAVLRLLMGLSTAETAELLDRPEATVRTHLHRARLLLRSRWSAPVAHGMLVLPWLMVDAGRSLAGLGSGGAVPLPAVFATVVAAGFLGGLGGHSMTGAGDSAGPGSDATVETVREDLARVRRDEAELRAVRDERRAVCDQQRERHRELAVALDVAARGRRGHRVPVVPPEYGDALAQVDWSVIGENVVAFTRLLGRYAACTRSGGELENGWSKERDRRNGAILREAVKVWDDLPAHDQALPHTHPVFLANAIAAALEYVGKPLTAEQEARVVTEMKRGLEADRIRLAAYDDDTLELTKLREESELKEGLLGAIRALLTDAQRAVLWPEGILTRVGIDLFSPGIIWSSAQRLKHVDCVDREDFIEELSAGIRHSFGVTASETGTLGRIIADWAGGLPAECFVPSTDPLTAAGIPLLADLHAAARRTEDLLRRIGEGLPECADRSIALRYSTGVILPRLVDREEEVK